MDTMVYLYLASLLLVGLLSTRVMKLIKMPNVTGYILTGIIMGPFIFGLFFNNFDFYGANQASSPVYGFVNGLDWVSKIALGFIAFSIGSSFKTQVLKKVGKKVLVITILESLGASVVVALLLLLTHFIWPDVVSLPLALTLSAIAAATAPAATLMVIKQYQAKGPLVDTLLPVVALDDGSALILFAVLFQIAKVLAVGSGFDAYMMIVKPIIEIVISCAIGAILGTIMSFASIFFRSRTNRLIWTILVIFSAIGLYYLFRQEKMGGFELSSLLTCMTAGAIFVNFRKDSFITFEFMDRFTAPIYMLFFVLSGASLDLTVFFSQGGFLVAIVAIIYAISRVAGKWSGAYVGARVTKAEPQVQKYLGFCLIPQAGVAIGLASNAKTIFGENAATKEIGASILAVVLASTIIYELIGPIVSKTALIKAGEIKL